MATSRAQSQLCRHLSLFLFALTFCQATVAKDFEPSRYQPVDGAKFYLLSEETFGATDVAKVRLEAPPYQATTNNGVDIRLYRVPNALKFLESQKNLHRPKVEGNYQGEGIRNAVHFVWDVLYKKTRLVWQRLISAKTREKAVKENPSFKQVPAHAYQTKMENNPQFGFLPGMKLIQSFRYPLQHAKPIQPKDVSLSGSSSNFIGPKEGTIFVPFGKLSPGLYIVEGILGKYRANCLLFVSNTVAVTKISSDELFTWTVDRQTGRIVKEAKLNFTDGVGRLGSGVTDADGVFALRRKELERTYVFGEDKDGGVFISENFYYDSEIYSHKLYVVTDRPLYRPGETVFFKGVGRNFKNSLDSVVLPDGKAELTVTDPSGLVIWQKNLNLAGGTISGSFPVPAEAVSGGYEVAIKAHNIVHTSFVRVANFVKPHFEVEVELDEKDLFVGKPLEAVVSMKYPNGLPVSGADVEVLVRKQKLSMVEGEVIGLDAFPVELDTKEMKSGTDGLVRVKIPAVDTASRLIIQVKATDDMSYRVNKSREVVVMNETGFLEISGENALSAPGTEVDFTVIAQKKDQKRSDLSVEIIRLEDQSKNQVAVAGDSFSYTFKTAGNYALNLLDKDKHVVATRSHWVEGEGLGTAKGTIDIVLDKDVYVPGETAKFLVNFPEEIDEALVTLERNKVERYALATAGKDWIALKKSGPRSFTGTILVQEIYAPNMTFSVVYVKNGQFVFQNKGIRVEVPKINISMSFDKARYAPGDKVTLEFETTLKGRAIASELAVSVVDEAIYSLQSELGPTIFDFFYHVRRNQVKTSASLAFHSFDAAVSAVDLGAPDGSYQQRNLKLMKDRARREDKDTAYWNPALKTDSDGKAKITFTMPDSITKWRVTARAYSGNFSVGERTVQTESFKSFYHTYVGPKHFRKGDAPVLHFLVFNNTGKESEVEVDLGGSGKKTLKVGREPAYLDFDRKWDTDTNLVSELKAEGTLIDKLATTVAVDDKAWVSEFVLGAGEKLPEDATKIRAYPMSTASDKVLSSLDALWEYPYGCVEQTSSRLLPLSLAYTALEKGSANQELLPKLQRRIASARGRLVRMAGPDADFTWWGDQTTGNLLLKVYAFYTDFYASRSLGIELPKANWESLLEDFKTKGTEIGFSSQALVLWMMKEMNLPVATLAKGVLEKAGPMPAIDKHEEHASVYFDHEPDAESWATGILILDSVLNKGVPDALVAKAKDALKDTYYGLSKAAVALTDPAYREQHLERLLFYTADYEEPTFDRAMTLALLWSSLKISGDVKAPALAAPWKKAETATGLTYYTYSEKALPTDFDLKNYKYSYQSASPVTNSLGVKIVRKFFRLKKIEQKEGEEEDPEAGTPFELGEEVKNGKFDSSELYVDRIEISPDKNYAFSVLEVPLVSGMELETQTWGISLKDGADAVTIGMGKPQGNYYAIPVDILNGELTYYNLVRPEVNGKFVLPPVRFHRMYAPHQMAFEGATKLDFKNVVVE